MPERRPRLRRLAYLTAVATSCAALALSLAGIARTEGHVKPDGNAAALAKQLERTHDVRDCQRPVATPGREV